MAEGGEIRGLCSWLRMPLTCLAVFAFCLHLQITCANVVSMSETINEELMSSDARRVTEAAVKVHREAIERIGSSLPGAIAGQPEDVRAYVSAYRELSELIAVEMGYEPSGSSGEIAVLAQEAMRAPFTDWVGTLGPGEGTAAVIVALLREMLPDTEPLPRPQERRQPAWGLDESEVLRFYRAVLDELEGGSAPLERIRDVLGINQTELASLFSVRRQALDYWSANGVPAERQEKLATLGEIADLLVAKLKTDRIPGVLRRPATAYGGRSALEAIADDEAELVLAELRDAFDWATAA
jgi:hypothetical protein